LFSVILLRDVILPQKKLRYSSVFTPPVVARWCFLVFFYITIIINIIEAAVVVVRHCDSVETFTAPALLFRRLLCAGSFLFPFIFVKKMSSGSPTAICRYRSDCY